MNNPVVKLPFTRTPVLRPTEGKLTLRAEHKTALDNIAGEAAAFARAADKIAEMAAEALANGGQLQIQPQVAFITGSLARVIKDWGVIEHLQRHGAQQKAKPRL